MARPTKFNKEIADKFIGFVTDGLSIRLSCKGCGISEDSVSRWRKQYPDFDKSLLNASSRQWKTSESLSKYGQRHYKRNERAYRPILSLADLSSAKPIFTLAPSNSYLGLPIQKEYPDSLIETSPYYNETANRIERIDRKGVFHVCSVDRYRMNILNNPNTDTYFVIV